MSHQPPLTADEIAEIERYLEYLTKRLPPGIQKIVLDEQAQVVKYLMANGTVRTVSARAILGLTLPYQEPS